MANLEYLHAKLFSEKMGISEGVLAGWLDRHWKKGVQYVVIGHQTLVHIERANEWISEHGQLASGPAVGASRSASGGTGRPSIPRQSRVTPTIRVISPQR